MRVWFKWMAAAAVLGLAACGGGGDEVPPPAQPGTIAQVAQANGLNSLVAAATKAGLVPALSNTSATLTVFAPTDAAFNTLATRLGFANGAALVNALPAPTLAAILNYHVLGSRQTSTDLAAGGNTRATLYSFGGNPATLTIGTTGGVTITDAVLTSASVATANVAASNGIVHVIDKVLVPPGVLTVVQMAQANPAFSTLVGAVVQANLAGTLSGAGPFTVFAPTNDAFAAIAGTVAGLDNTELATVLSYHVLNSQVLAANIPFGVAVPTAAGQSITINANPLRITDTTMTPAPIAATDIRASNGVIHVIGKVLLPAL